MGALCVGTAYAQEKGAKPDTGVQGHTAPKAQPATAPTPSAPTGELALGSVVLPKNVKADGKPLAAGTYQVRLTPQQATPDAKGQTPALERYVEFVKGGKVVGREVVSIVPQAEIALVQKDAPPKANGSKIETLKAAITSGCGSTRAGITTWCISRRREEIRN